MSYFERFEWFLPPPPQIVLCGRRLTDLALQDGEDSVRKESSRALAALCRTCPDVAVETVWPLIMGNIGKEGG